MAKVQSEFEQFHETIKLKRFKENEVLREKRDIIRGKVEERLPGVFAAHDEDCPAFRFRNQGSYEMGTGTKPLDGDFDIDQGLYFDIGSGDYPDPVVLKERVHEALDGHTKDVQIRRPCVTVFYERDDEPIYHVDLAIYRDGSQTVVGKPQLAKGKTNSKPEHRLWEIADPEGLTTTLFGRFTGTDRHQFRRVVRYLKRWRDENFPKEGYAAPLGIGLTVATYDCLVPAYSDVVAAIPDDLEALCSVVDCMLNRFASTWDEVEQRSVRRLVVTLPVEPQGDLFRQMTAKQMERLETKLQQLQEAIETARSAVDPVEACEALRKELGPDFPVPEKKDTAKRHAPAIVSSSNSA